MNLFNFKPGQTVYYIGGIKNCQLSTSRPYIIEKNLLKQQTLLLTLKGYKEDYDSHYFIGTPIDISQKDFYRNKFKTPQSS